MDIKFDNTGASLTILCLVDVCGFVRCFRMAGMRLCMVTLVLAAICMLVREIFDNALGATSSLVQFALLAL